MLKSNAESYRRFLLHPGLWLGLFCLLSASQLRAQLLPHYGQYMFNGLVLNPAYAGHKKVLDVSTLGRGQWLGFPGAPRTATLAVHAPGRKLKHNWGAKVVHDRLGSRHSNLLQGVYSYRLFLGEVSLSMGLQGGLAWLGTTNFQQLGVETQGDPNLLLDLPNVVLPQVGTGLWVAHPKFYLGLSVPELMRINTQRYDLYYGNAVSYRHLFATAGFLLKASRDVRIKPSILMKYTRNVPIQFDLNTNVIFKDLLVTGISYRTVGTWLGLVEWHPNSQFRIGFSYEFNRSRLRTVQSGTAELSLGYSFGFKVKTPGLRFF